MSVGLGSEIRDGSTDGAAVAPADEGACQRDTDSSQDLSSQSTLHLTELFWKSEAKVDKYSRAWRKCCKVKRSQITVLAPVSTTQGRKQGTYKPEQLHTLCNGLQVKTPPAKRELQIFWQY